MERPRRITDSFPRRRRLPTGPRTPAKTRTPGKGKTRTPGKNKTRTPGKGKILPRSPTPPTEDPPSPPPPPQPPETLLEMLRLFDLAWEYGPCSGITRLERWQRAQELGLCPPRPVLDALLEHPDNPEVTYSLWHQYKL